MRRIWVALGALALVVFGSVAQAADCGVAGTAQSVPIGQTGRSMLIHLPRGFDPAGPAPLVFVLHGSGGTGAGMLKGSKLAEAADRHGFIVAAPDAGIPHDKGFVWNIPGVPTVAGNIPGPNDPDDVAYIKAAIDWLSGQGCVDATRVYATGLSGGGRMTSWLGCVAADRFAAIAPVVGLRAGNPSKDNPKTPDPATCKPSRALPVMAFAGDKDTTNPIEGGGKDYWQYTMHAAEQRWAQLNDCQAAPVTQWVGLSVYEERYSGCRDGADVAGRVTVGGGHTWVADNDAMWSFFSEFRRN
jgi:polyhydroxybutyrate depolymerase